MSEEDASVAKIIVAEDQVAMRQLLARSLRELGFDVIEVGDGAMLWQELHDGLKDEDNPREADLIVTDINMPARTGLEVLELIHASTRPLPVIVMTAFGDAATHERARTLGAARVFDKPFELSALLREVVRLLPAPG